MHQILRYRCVYFFVNLNLGIVFISVLDTLNFRMEHITDQTTIADLSKIHVPKCYEKCVYKAIGSSTKLMTIKEFIDTTEFNINPETFDILFMNINDEDIPIYIDDAMLDWMGYSRNDSLIKHINRNFEEGIEYKNLKNNKYKEFLDEETNKFKDTQVAGFKSNFPKPATGSSARSIKHLIVMPDAFRSLCMMINTEKGKQIRKYYITLEKLIKSYNLYQTIYRGQEAERAMSCKGDKIDSLSLQISSQTLQMEKQTREMEKQRIESEKQSLEIRELLGYAKDSKSAVSELSEELKDTNITLKSVAKQRVEIDTLDLNKHPKFIILKDPNDDQMPYYAIRRQQESVRDAIDEIMSSYPELKVWIKIPQPNAVAFFNLIKKELGIHMIRDGNWFGLKDIEPSAFKKKIKALNKKRSNPLKKISA
jgi:phage anti-repressor protein